MSDTDYSVQNSLPEVIHDTIRRYDLIPAGAKVVVGVSGGADSTALLRALHQLGIPCTAAHLNHGLRGTEAEADERFVRDLADELGLPVEVEHADVRALASAAGLSIEMAARQARHDFFGRFEQAVIALAHHADDQIETFLLRLARGAGPEGLGGMAFHQEIGPIRLIRPMLNIRRSAVVQWLETGGFAWREDASNTDEGFLRNRVRHTILPLLERELNPRIGENVLRTMMILREENDFLNQAIEKMPADSAAPQAAKRRHLRSWLFAQGVTEVGFDAVEKILALMNAGEGTTVYELSARQRVVVEYGVPRLEQAEPTAPARFQLTVERGTGWQKDHGRGAGILPAEASFDAERVGDAPIEVRGWQPGDRMAPHGMKGSRKLQDIFTDQKIPLSRRSALPVVTCRGEIIWLPGYRTARGWEVPHEWAASVHVRVEPQG